MKLLLDACVWGGARRHLEEAGHEVDWVGDWDRDPGDLEILAHAVRESRLLVTLDKDFGELVIVRGERHSGIIRLLGFSARRQGEVCAQVLAAYETELVAGALLTVEPGRVRIRPRDESSVG